MSAGWIIVTATLFIGVAAGCFLWGYLSGMAHGYATGKAERLRLAEAEQLLHRIDQATFDAMLRVAEANIETGTIVGSRRAPRRPGLPSQILKGGQS